MGQRLAGVCYVKADGQQFSVAGGLECPLTDVTREAVKSVNKVEGYKETARTPYVKFNGIFTPDFPLDSIRNATAMTVVAEYANGKVYTLSGAFVVGDPAAKNDDGTSDLEFNGLKGSWS